ncbi:MAG: 4-hydroxythreonine-4-phosphate dehydrogenase PdxA [Pseudomonadales bacterium]|nr:4-hydroxythreonine-4-phosphate dehydrogenase PdxA [Pseudomonadales bacterium]
MSKNNPIIAITQGDACGIGPEVVAKALATGEPAEVCRPVVIGSMASMQQGIDIAGVQLTLRAIQQVEEVRAEKGVVDVLDSGALDPADINPGTATKACGVANGVWLGEASDLALADRVAACVMAPVNGEVLKLGPSAGKVFGSDPSQNYLTLLSGPLRVVHVFDHIMLEDVCRKMTKESIYNAIRRTNEVLIGFGIATPRIGVAGLNPHAHGPQETSSIIPGVEEAQAEGIDVKGPISPDSVFRHGIDGIYDVVIAMFHDQGHIAIKTWGFVGNCAMFMGAPYLSLSVGHGTAFDIVGKGIASHEMILSAIMQAASLSAGKGFVK